MAINLVIIHILQIEWKECTERESERGSEKKKFKYHKMNIRNRCFNLLITTINQGGKSGKWICIEYQRDEGESDSNWILLLGFMFMFNTFVSNTDYDDTA
jgi:hypothetical protein